MLDLLDPEVGAVRMRGAQSSMDPKVWMDQFSSRLMNQLQERVYAWEENGVLAPPVEEVLEQVNGLLPAAEPSVLGEEIGPFYDTSAVMTVLGGVSKQAVEARRRKHTILALKTADGHWVYPTFQFEGGSVDLRLKPAIQDFRDGPAWSVALWFCTPNPDLEDLKPLEWARRGHSLKELRASAVRTASEWSVFSDDREPEYSVVPIEGYRRRGAAAARKRAVTS